MIGDEELMAVRRAFAKQIVHAAHAKDPRLEKVLGNLRREDFLPPGPWKIWIRDSYLSTPNDDPVYLYQDVAVAILPDKGLNNGKPSFVSFLISSGRLSDGEHAVHVGTGLSRGCESKAISECPRCARGRLDDAARLRQRNLRECRRDAPR
jgi:protein-L-isoaspartate(D-aspartate) O-methyltransferase